MTATLSPADRQLADQIEGGMAASGEIMLGKQDNDDV